MEPCKTHKTVLSQKDSKSSKESVCLSPTKGLQGSFSPQKSSAHCLDVPGSTPPGEEFESEMQQVHFMEKSQVLSLRPLCHSNEPKEVLD